MLKQTFDPDMFWQSKFTSHLLAYVNTHPRLTRFLGNWLLIYTLAKRDIQVRYRRSVIGIFWAILDPLFFLGVFAVLRAFLGISTGDMPYLVFTFSGLIPWTLFLTIVNACAPSIMSNASILKKMILPREIFLLIGAITAVFDFLMSLLVMFLMMLFYRVHFTWYLLWLPFLVGLLVILALGMGMYVAAYGIFRRDYIKISAYVFQLLFFLSPIFYPIDAVPQFLRQVYVFNPLVGLLEGFRSVLGAGKMPDLLLLAYALPTIIIVFVIGWIAFREKSPYFTDVL